MSHLEHFSADAPQGAMLDAIRRDGAIIVDALVDQNALAALRRETCFQISRSSPQTGRRLRRSTSLASVRCWWYSDLRLVR